MISCQCITFNRPELLEEAIESFLKQDYVGEKELVILNDSLEQELIFEHPEVFIFNFRRRFRTVGEKRNACVAMCKGNVIFPWDDDDICLPWRISLSLKYKENSKYFKPQWAWLWQNGEIKSEPAKNVYHAMGCWDRGYFEEAEGYPMIQSGQDVGIEKRFEKKGGRHVTEISKEEIYYIYRFGGTGSPHLSSYGWGKGWEEIGKREISKTGKIILKPEWRDDYEKRTKERISGIKELQSV